MPQSDARAACKALRAVRGEVFVHETFTAAEAQAATPSIPSEGKATPFPSSRAEAKPELRDPSPMKAMVWQDPEVKIALPG
jgi:hypothetical protein